MVFIMNFTACHDTALATRTDPNSVACLPLISDGSDVVVYQRSMLGSNCVLQVQKAKLITCVRGSLETNDRTFSRSG